MNWVTSARNALWHPRSCQWGLGFADIGRESLYHGRWEQPESLNVDSSAGTALVLYRIGALQVEIARRLEGDAFSERYAFSNTGRTPLELVRDDYLETALAFLGLEDPTAVTWGTILEHAFERTAISSGAWWAIVPAGFAIAAVIVGCFLFGQAVEDALNPRLKVAHLSLRPWRLRPLVGRGPGAL